MPLTVYRSSAGSGKTYTLVKEYLKLALKSGRSFKHILAVTFTNKAAGEMKERIIDYLQKLSLGEMSSLRKQLHEETGQSEEEIRKKAAGLLSAILHEYSDFAVMTIDSFIHRIIRSFAMELDMPLGFDVDLNTRELIDKITDLFIEGLQERKPETEVLLQYVMSKIELRGNWSYDNDIKQTAGELFSETGYDKLRSFSNLTYDEVAAWTDETAESRFAFERGISSTAVKVMELIETGGFGPDDFSGKSRGIYGQFRKLVSASSPDDFENISKKSFSEGKWVTKTHPKRDEVMAFCNRCLEPLRLKIMDIYNKGYKRYLTDYSILRNIHMLTLMGEIERIMERYKAENDIVPISDINLKVSEMIDTEIVPYIFWKAGEKFNHYLIDEFQDTNSVQWKNLLPLIETSVSEGNLSLCVGDPKQSIYRWRGGDTGIMLFEVPAYFPEGLYEERHLSENWRSERAVVEFNNRFFSGIKAEEGGDNQLLDSAYDPADVEQRAMGGGRGKVSVVAVEGTGNEFKGNAMAEVISVVNSYAKDGGALSNITLLVRTNREGVFAASALFEEGIPVFSAESLLLDKDPDVRFLISLFRYAAVKDELAAAEILRYLKGGQSGAFFAGLSNAADIEEAFRREYPKEASYLTDTVWESLYDAAESMVRLFGLTKDNSAFITGFLDCIYTFSEKGSGGIAEFVTWWEDNRESDKTALKTAPGRDAVNIMTIHKSKGLEFPVVIIPFCAWEIELAAKGFNPNQFWVDDVRDGAPYLVTAASYVKESGFSEAYNEEGKKTYVDNLNLLYVAFTRAVAELCVIIPEEGNNVSRLIRDRLEAAGMAAENGRYTSGERVIEKRQEKSEKGLFIKGAPCYPWKERLAVRRRSRDEWEGTLGERGNKIREGLLIHDIMSRITDCDEIEAVCLEMEKKGVIERGGHADMAGKIEDVMDIPVSGGCVRDWFKPGLKIYSERSILDEKGTYRPDRVVEHGGRVTVIDYKTGEPSPEHHEQVRDYGTLLKDMGYETVEGYLVYTGLSEAVKVEI